MATQADLENLTGVKDDYAYGFHDEEKPVFKSKRGLDHSVIDQISDHKNEPDWMRKFRHEALDIFLSKPMPTWGADLSGIDFEEIFYYLKPSSGQGKSWDDVPEGIKNTFERLGIPEAERKFLAGVGAQYDSEVVYHSLRAEWEKLGVIFLDMDSGLREHEDIIREYFATIIPAADNKFAALNSAVWSGGSFVYVPKGGEYGPVRTHVDHCGRRRQHALCRRLYGPHLQQQ
jgi:Fe-S cluster assembly protein SufB